MMAAFTITGKVSPGEKTGRTIDFPTANLSTTPNPTQLQPGVYTGRCSLNDSGQWLNCLIYFGPRYVQGQSQNTCEVHILDFNQEIYGATLTARVDQFIRPPLKFESLMELKKQIIKDKLQAENIFNQSPQTSPK